MSRRPERLAWHAQGLRLPPTAVRRRPAQGCIPNAAVSAGLAGPPPWPWWTSC